MRPYYTDAEHFYLHRHIILPSIEKTIVDYLRGIPVGFPESCFKDLNEGDEATTLPLIELMSQSLELLRETTGYFFAAAGDATTANRTFFKLRHQLVENIITRSGFTRETAREDKLIRIGDSRNDDLPITEVVNLYFAETPFMDFLLMPTPFEIPAEARKEHTLVVGGAGAGKTTLLQQLILDDLAQPDPPPMVIVDPKGLLVDRISKLDVFNPDNGRLKDRLVVFDPDDQPSLNMFDAGQSTPETRQPIQNQIIGNFGYIFSAGGFKLTPKQQVDFSYVVRLLFSIPNANILTMLDILDDPAKKLDDFTFAPQVAGLDEISQRFFKNDFFTEFKESKAQIKARLYMILQHPEVAASLSAAASSIDLAECLADRNILLVNTGMTTLGAAASTLLGRYFVSLTLSAAFARMKKGDTSFASLIVDEYQEFADELKTPEIMRLAREYSLGLTIATQTVHGSPFTDNLRTSLSTNTSVKYASSPEGTDINYVARDLRCDAEFIRAQTKTATHGRFACFVRGILEHPVSITVPFGNIQRQPQMTDEQHAAMRKASKERLSAKLEPEASMQEREVPTQPRPASAPLRSNDDPDAGEHTEAAPKWGD